jgi:proline iminopeptidase
VTSYPNSSPFNKGTLKVDGYTLPYEEYGNPEGTPIVFLHGGPGAGTSPDAYQSFDPKVFRIIVYDQRGAGKSTPSGGLKDNTPDLLADDLEKLKKHLGIEKWHVAGGSWGSTLALLYAEKYPASVKSLTLQGIYLLRKKDQDLCYQATDIIQPETMKRFREFLPENERADLEESYYKRLFSEDPAVHLPALREICRFGFATFPLHRPLEEHMDYFDPEALGSARIEWSILHNHKLTPEDRLLRDIGKIRHIPTMIIQGRYDLTCPPQIAFDLKQAFPEAQLQMVTAGHSTYDPDIAQALAQAYTRLRDTGSPLVKKPPSLLQKIGLKPK